MTTCNVSVTTSIVYMELSDRPYTGHTSIIDVNRILDAAAEIDPTVGYISKISIGNDGNLVLGVVYDNFADLVNAESDARIIQSTLMKAWDADEDHALKMAGVA